MTKKVLEVPKIKQLKLHCGPACLSMIAQYLGYDLSQEQIAEYFGGSEIVKKKGIKRTRLIHCARDFGFVAHPYFNLGLEGVVSLIDKDLPIITTITEGKRGWFHFCVVKGYQTNPNILYINDPKKLSLERVLYENFARRWRVRIGKPVIQYGLVLRNP